MARIKPIDCNKCPEKPKCIKLCAAAEAYVNQDWSDRPTNEILMSDLSPAQKAAL